MRRLRTASKSPPEHLNAGLMKVHHLSLLKKAFRSIEAVNSSLHCLLYTFTELQRIQWTFVHLCRFRSVHFPGNVCFQSHAVFTVADMLNFHIISILSLNQSLISLLLPFITFIEDVYLRAFTNLGLAYSNSELQEDYLQAASNAISTLTL